MLGRNNAISRAMIGYIEMNHKMQKNTLGNSKH